MKRTLISTDIALRWSAGHESNFNTRYRRGEFVQGGVVVGFRYDIFY